MPNADRLPVDCHSRAAPSFAMTGSYVLPLSLHPKSTLSPLSAARARANAVSVAISATWQCSTQIILPIDCHVGFFQILLAMTSSFVLPLSLRGGRSPTWQSACLCRRSQPIYFIHSFFFLMTGVVFQKPLRSSFLEISAIYFDII